MIALYCGSRSIREQLEALLPAGECQPVDSREEFHSAVVRFGAGVFAALECDQADAKWVARLVETSPHVACAVVVPLSLSHLQSFRPFLSDRLRLVWLDEVAEQLPEVIRQTRIDHTNPLHLLAREIVASRPLSPVARRALEEICCPQPTVENEPPHRPIPPKDMGELARRINHSISGIRVHWGEHVPLRCTPKKLMEWALLIWAVSDTVLPSGSARARYLGIHPRTLERICARLVKSRISEAIQDPEAVRSRFEQWLEEVMEPPPANAPGWKVSEDHD